MTMGPPHTTHLNKEAEVCWLPHINWKFHYCGRMALQEKKRAHTGERNQRRQLERSVFILLFLVRLLLDKAEILTTASKHIAFYSRWLD